MDVHTLSGTKSGADKTRFEVKKWNAVALWAWDIVVDNCAICRNNIMAQANQASDTSEECTVVNTLLAGVYIRRSRMGIPE
ncbi:E3 ubiquitin-protein ligase RBX1, partial [Podarcis lilfordi]